MKRLTPCLSIKKFCIECAGSFNDARDCTANAEDIAKMVKFEDRDNYPECPLYPYRLGKRPKAGAGLPHPHKKIDSTAQKGHFQSSGNKTTGGQR